MSEWKEKDLRELITHKKGFAFKSALYKDSGRLVVRVSDTTSNSIDINSCVKIDEIIASNYKDYELSIGDIIIMTVGSWPDNPASVVGKVISVPFNADKALLNQNAVRIRGNGNVDNKYLYHRLKNSDFSGYIVNNAQGSANQASITLEDIFSFKFNLPSKDEQQAIANILSSLDDKIDLLHRQNATLEAMAETLFRKWFVEEAKENWEEITLFDAIDLIGGGTPKTSIPEYWNGNIKWLSGGDIANNHKSIIISSEKSITEFGLKNSSAKLLPRFSTIISARGTVGKYCILSEPMTFSQSNYGIKPKFDNCYFFTYLLIAHSVDELISAAYGSVFDTITTDTFKGHSVTLPKLDVIKNFEIRVTPLFKKMLNNQTQIRTLTALRDTLLPKLMSGEVRVEI